MTQAPKAVYLEFDRRRKLHARHRYVRECVRASGKPVTELVQDPFGGHPFLIQALLTASASEKENITLDKASDLLDAYYDKGGTLDDLRNALMEVLSAYLHIEQRPAPGEEVDDSNPNADSPAAPGPSVD